MKIKRVRYYLCLSELQQITSSKQIKQKQLTKVNCFSKIINAVRLDGKISQKKVLDKSKRIWQNKKAALAAGSTLKTEQCFRKNVRV